ncbi:FAD-binding oxidoreductase [Streptomyces polygonati]|uniref:FAD-binding oxidoreductase n=1 Tax=Streptomyces polygonati TaxID=1617087 RepID=A0ABV8HJC7_9ACTN
MAAVAGGGAGGSAGASEADWGRLAKSVTGRLLRPGDAGFQDGSAPFNRRYTRTVPTGVLNAADVADVRQAVRWARETGVPIVPRGGGHSYGGYSVNSGLVLNLQALGSVTVDGSTGLVVTGGGALTEAVYTAVAPHQAVFPLGNGATVGVAGLALGGGSAATSRALGLTADTMVRTEIITADGESLVCDAEHNTDLFWACRGGGGGNFGVNVSFTFQAVPIADVSTFLLLWEGPDALKVFEVAQEVMRRAPDAFSARLGASRSAGTGITVSAIGLHLGPSAELRELLDPLLAVARPFREDIADRTFWEGKDYLAHETSAGAFAVRTHFAAEPLPPQAVATALEQLDRWPGGGNPDGCGMALFGWGGAINRVDPGSTAFPHRDAHYLVSLDTSWGEQDSPALVEANLRWLTDLHDSLTPWTTGGSYLNFADPDLADWRTAYYGANYDRLLAVKRRVDPDGLFTFPQGIGA